MVLSCYGTSQHTHTYFQNIQYSILQLSIFSEGEKPENSEEIPHYNRENNTSIKLYLNKPSSTIHFTMDLFALLVFFSPF